jgi:hypothetical protein
MSARSGSPVVGGGAVGSAAAIDVRRGSARALGERVGVVRVAVALTLLALAVRLPCVRQSLFGDELFLYVDVHRQPLGEVLSTVRHTEKTPPLGFVLGWLFARGGDADSLVRVPSLVASVATVPLIYALGARTVGRAAGLVASAWFALSAFQILYGTDARAYALVTALAASLIALAAVGVGTVTMLDPDYQRTDARDAAHWVDAHAPPGAPLVDWPGPHGIRLYVERTRRVLTVSQFGPRQWAAAARARTPVFMSFPDVAGLGKLLGPPAGAAPGYRLVAGHTARGIPSPLVVREYAPR